MSHIESLQEFYDMFENQHLFLPEENRIVRQFNIFPRWNCSGAKTYLRRDFYRIVLTKDAGILNYADHRIEINSPAIFVANKVIPYSWESLSEKQEGWVCLFSSEFLDISAQYLYKEIYPILNMQTIPVCFLDDNSLVNFIKLFEEISSEFKSNYHHKYNLLQNYLHVLLHQIQKMEKSISQENQNIDAAHRTTFRFLELLEQQYPIQSPNNPLILRTAQDFAQKLFVHVNHLNSSVKKVSGKTSSNLISERIIIEAKELLQNSDWNISEIARALGFEYSSHFTNFFKKHVGVSPKALRLR